MAVVELTAELRETSGKGVARKLRAKERIPGIIYGPGEESMKISLLTRDFDSMLRKAAGGAVVIDLKLAGKGSKQNQHVLIKEVQRDPVDSRLLHIDLLAVAMDKPVTTLVPLKLNGVPYGVKTDGGMLDVVLRDIPVTCMAKDIPDYVESDITEMQVGDSLKIGDIKLDNIEFAIPDDRIVAAVHGKTAEAVEEEAAEAAAAAAAAEGAPAGEEGAASEEAKPDGKE